MVGDIAVAARGAFDVLDGRVVCLDLACGGKVMISTSISFHHLQTVR